MGAYRLPLQEKSMSVQQFQQVSYGLTQPLILEAQLPIVSLRAPTTADKALIGSIWVQTTTNTYWVLTSIANNLATWITFGGGGAGVFTSLTVTPGNLTVTNGNIVASLGNISATAGSLSAGTTVTAGTGITATTGNITASTGNIVATLGNLTATAGSVSAGANVTAANNVTATAGNVTAVAGAVNAGTTMTAGTGITATTGNITATTGNLVATVGLVSIGGLHIIAGAGADPNGLVNAPLGSLFMTSGGTGIANRLWVNTDGVTAWTNFVSAA